MQNGNCYLISIMGKKIEYKIPQTGESITVAVTIHNDYLSCIENLLSPLKHNKTVLQPGIDHSKYKCVVVRCNIGERQRLKIDKVPGLTGESIFREVAAQFIKDNYKARRVLQTEALSCNQYEIQYKYIFED
jgi:hypothetical protein